jgi:hypothetical protein
MSEGLGWDVVSNPEELFARGAPFVETFSSRPGEDGTPEQLTRAPLINPMDHPLEFAREVARLNPRHPQSVFRQPGAVADEYADRYKIADNGLPAWAAPHEDVINNTAHNLGVRDRELGSTFQHDMSPGGHFGLGLVLEGANRASKNRGDAMAAAIRNGDITVDQVRVAGTDRKVGEREGHGDITTGYGVAEKTVAQLKADHPDVFGKGGVPIDVLDVRTRKANTREVANEAALRTGAGSVAMTGSNIYGTWMRTDLATVQHNLGLDKVGFSAGPDDPKAARTPLIWAAENAQALVSAAHLRDAQINKPS